MKNEIVEIQSSLTSGDKGKKGIVGFFSSPAALIRLCAILFVGLMIGHMSAYPFTQDEAPGGKQLVYSMKSVGLVFFGERSTYWNLYFGWGLWVAVLLLTFGIVLWLVSDFVRFAPRRVAVITGILSATCFTGACISFRFFFIPPFLMLSIMGLIMLTATIQLLRKP